MPDDDKLEALSFHNRAKKFKKGPTARPDKDEDHPDMSGRARSPGDEGTPEGAPGQLKKMPGE